MPWTMGAFAVGALSMIGLPPTVGFLSKWYMLSGALAAAQWLALAVIVVSTLLNAGYFLPIVYRAFFAAEAAPSARGARRGAAPWSRRSSPPPPRPCCSSSSPACRSPSRSRPSQAGPDMTGRDDTAGSTGRGT